MRRLYPLVGLTLALAGCHSTSKKTDPTPVPAVVTPAAPLPAAVAVLRMDAVRESGAMVFADVGGAMHVLLADEDERAIVEIDPATKSIVATTSLPSRPRDLLVLADGRLAVTLPEANAVALYTRDASPAWNEVARAKTPADPQAMASDPTDNTLYVTTGASHQLVGLNTKMETTRSVTLGREPRAVLASADHVFVTHGIEDYLSVVDDKGAVEQRRTGNHASCNNETECSGARVARNAESIIRTSDHSFVVPSAQSMPVPSRAFSKSALCRFPRATGFDDFDDFTPSRPQLAKTAKTSAQPEEPKGYGLGDTDNGPPVTADLPTFDTNTTKKWGTGEPPNLGAGCLLPRAGVATDNGGILVACTGSARVVLYAPKPTYDDEWRGKFVFDAKGKPVRGDFSNGIEPNVSATMIDVPSGPSAIAKHGDSVLVWSLFARTLSQVRNGKAEEVLKLDSKRDADWRRGRELFFTNGDARISKDGRACANCHVDGIDDGLTWKTPMGPRRTRLLRGELANGPYGWNGEHATLAEHVQSTFKNLGGTGLPDDERAKLLAYVSSLSRPKQEEADVAKGKALFATAECSHCHSAGLSDRQLHDVGTGGNFMTPTLASAGERRALMHDGRFKTLDELIVGSPNMGRGAELSPDDRKQLEAYIETL
jgi:mono/diheme cytochrome c family protein